MIKELRVRVGGSFVWPPRIDESGRLCDGYVDVGRVVMVAGGVGIK